MEPEPTTHTVATNDLPAKWRNERASYPTRMAAAIEEGVDRALTSEAHARNEFAPSNERLWSLRVKRATFDLEMEKEIRQEERELCANELEAVLRAEAKAHEETARDLAAWLYGYVEVARQMVTDPKVVQEIAAALASVRRATLRDAWQVCPVTGEAHNFPPPSKYDSAIIFDALCVDCRIHRAAVSPADVKGENQ